MTIMREIKFRAWDKLQKRMLTVYSLSHPVVVVIDYKTTGDDAIENNYRVNLNDVEPYRDIASENVEVMQSTGLKDRNGKEIYEGDVVRAVAESQYAEQSGCFQVILSFDLAWALANIDEEHGLSPTWGGWESLEVIGNIYENPELLNVCPTG